MKNLRRKLSYTLYILLATCLYSCAGEDEYGCYKSVQEEFPNAIDISSPIGERYRFVVIDADSTVYYVETMNQNDTEVTQTELIYKW